MKNTFKRLSAFSVGLLALVSASPSAQATAGQLYSGGFNTHKVYRFSSSGVQSTFVTAPPTEPNAEYDSIAFDSKGNLFVSDTQNQVLVKITPGGTITTFDSGYAPAGLAFNAAGNLFVGDSGFGNIYKYLPNGTKTTFASGVSGPFGLAFDRAGNLYVSEFNTNSILKFPPNFVVGDTPITFASGLHGPQGLAFDSAGNLFEVDFSTGGINKISPAGVVTPFATSLSGPRHLAFDRNGNLFASDFGTQRILEFPPNFAVGDMPISFASSTTAAGLAFEPPTAQLTNISTRASVQTGQRVTIAGFIVTGTDSKSVVVRGLGPTLTQYNVTGVLADPFLSLQDGSGNVLWNNNDWKDSQQTGIQNLGFACAGAPCAPPNDLESAILRTVAPGNYSAILSGRNSTTGVGLVEVYDISTGVFAELANVSTRGFVGTDQNVMIGGFITSGGNGATQVVVRGLGPTLTQYGVTGVLADPFLSLVDGNGTVLWNNNDWKDSQQTEIQNLGLACAGAPCAPPNDLESAILRTVAPGNYTAILSGRNRTTGIGLVEIYKVK